LDCPSSRCETSIDFIRSQPAIYYHASLLQAIDSIKPI
jgi:hypothetical protein